MAVKPWGVGALSRLQAGVSRLLPEMFASAPKPRGHRQTIVMAMLFHGSGLPGRQHRFSAKEPVMSLGTILLVIVILALLGALPTWPHSQSWGYGPSGGMGLVLIILVVLLLLGRI
jgi:hypothetical protein